ncbi:formylglycine-generating enzyme family protein [Leucothrix mucor]|uniref:formylglycine-generating enzyme family protein n=1 Tax=Leucothrix mucor TaxID=45248 RepID=UPI0003B3F6D3|nr:formylglycine-generating enzyme family protein [Leucothrix mucor]
MDDKQSKDKQPLDRYLQVYTRDEVKVFFDRAVTELERRDQAAKKRKDRYWLWGFIGALAVIVAVVLGIKLSGQTIADKAQQLVVNNPQYKVIPQGEAPGLYPNMLPIPGGEMVMGCSVGKDDIVGCRDTEYPAHLVTVKSFEIAQHEVTVAQFRQFILETDYLTDSEKELVGCVSLNLNQGKPSWYMDPEYSWHSSRFEMSEESPVVCISWDDTQAYIKWINAKTGRQYRLPTGAEWEYAARAGSSTAFAWGDRPRRKFANYKGVGGADRWRYSSPVGSFPPNAFNLYDMAGNVWEWVEDCWHERYDGAPKDGSAWLTQCDKLNTRTRRGGAWDTVEASVRPAIRSKGGENDRSYVYGFRLAHDFIDTKSKK